ncbi:sensor histidine kinase [Streptomyces paludis]|uniref:histidine kinase n=1 Tax=Streptomyces paludis TaxID=2282738 RepID=A0A345I1X7_9ACTN|nr:sensor histidine kinase [Streptomyces paludis]
MTLTLAILMAVAGAVLAAYFRHTSRRAERKAALSQERAERLAWQLGAVEGFVGYVADTVVPAAAVKARTGRSYRPDLAAPSQLAGTPIAGAIGALAGQVASVIAVSGQQAQKAAEEQLAQARRDADQRVALVRRESGDVARAAVRAFASSTVQRASKLSTQISAGVRRHVSDEAYETLVEIDHLAQQMLLTASGYAVLAGEKLSRRHPVTVLTDVVRSAMGRVEGYQRVLHPEMDSLAVESRAVEAVVHTLAILLDNALRYSPPNARVHVSLEHSNGAVFLVVDDAGLRMEDERLSWARRVMASAERDDITALGAYPQTGLRVAAILAAGYGYRVEVTAPNVYGGTRAFLVLPQNLLTTPPPPPVPTPPTRQQPTPEPEPVVSSTTANGLTVRQRPAKPAAASPGVSVAPSVGPGRPEVSVAWLEGSRRGRGMPSNSPETEGR